MPVSAADAGRESVPPACLPSGGDIDGMAGSGTIALERREHLAGLDAAVVRWGGEACRAGCPVLRELAPLLATSPAVGPANWCVDGMDRERLRNIAAVMSVVGAVAALIGWSLWSRHGPGPEDRRIVSVAVSKSGTWLAAGITAGRIAVWKLGAVAQPLEIRDIKGALNDLQFSPDERWLAVANRNLTVYPLESVDHPLVLRTDRENYGTARFSSDGDTILTVTGGGVIEILDAKDGRAITRVCCSTIAGAVAFSPDGSFFFSAGHLPRMWETRSGSLVARLTQEREFMCLGPIAFLGNGVLMGSQDGGIRVWDRRTRQRIAASPRSPDWVDTIAVQERTGLVAYAGAGKTLRVWNPETAVHYSVAGVQPTSNIVFSAEGLLIAGLANGTIEFWDLSRGLRRAALRFPPVN